MERLLQATKLQIPPQPPHMLSRIRLVDDLERLLSEYKLILLSAPAGYGKTTLLAQWAGSTRLLVVWLSVGAKDNDVVRFLCYLAASW